MTESRRVSYFYDAEVGNYHYGQGEISLAWHYNRYAMPYASGCAELTQPNC